VKDVAAGTHRMPAGGPVCSSPLLVASEGRIEARTIRALNKLVRDGRGWRSFLGANKWKLLAATAAYLVYGVVFAWLWRRLERVPAAHRLARGAGV
jgi:hypothetical protein